jgi:hypothetical protein
MGYGMSASRNILIWLGCLTVGTVGGGAIYLKSLPRPMTVAIVPKVERPTGKKTVVPQYEKLDLLKKEDLEPVETSKPVEPEPTESVETEPTEDVEPVESEPVEPERPTRKSQNRSFTRITRSGHLAAERKEDLDRAIRYVSQKDEKALNRLIESDKVFLLKAGVEVYTEGCEGFFCLIIKIRPIGEDSVFYTTREAVRK